jgi:hypothetical protein
VTAPGGVAVDPGLGLPHLAEDDRLRAVLAAVPGVPRTPPAPLHGACWGPGVFELEGVTAWRDADPSTREAVLVHAGDALLREACAIERLGLAFTAKMVLLAPSVEERMLYASFAADEARHLALLSGFRRGALRGDVPPPQEQDADNPFVDLLAEVIARGDRATLVLVVQCVLEGWGLEHYRRLADSCAVPALGEAFHAILRDEARHHGSGLLIAPRLDVPDDAIDVLTRLCGMVRVGPVGVLAALEHGVGPLGRDGRLRALRELHATEHAARRLRGIRTLLARAGADRVVAALSARDAFTPIDPEQVA